MRRRFDVRPEVWLTFEDDGKVRLAEPGRRSIKVPRWPVMPVEDLLSMPDAKPASVTIPVEVRHAQEYAWGRTLSRWQRRRVARHGRKGRRGAISVHVEYRTTAWVYLREGEELSPERLALVEEMSGFRNIEQTIAEALMGSARLVRAMADDFWQVLTAPSSLERLVARAVGGRHG